MLDNFHSAREALDSHLAYIVGKPVQSVRLGIGSFLFLNFDGVYGIEENPPQDGMWQIWIYCCRWKLSDGSTIVAHSEIDRDKLKRSVQIIGGLKLEDVRIELEVGLTRFLFSGDISLTLNPYDQLENKRMWMLLAPTNACLAVTYPPFDFN